MFQTNLFMGNCSWLTIGTRVQRLGFWVGEAKNRRKAIIKRTK